MNSKRLDALQKRLDDIQGKLTELDDAGEAAGGLTEDQEQTYSGLTLRAAELGKQITEESRSAVAMLEARNTLQTIRGAAPAQLVRAAEPAELTAGEYLAEYFQAHHRSGNGDREGFLQRTARYNRDVDLQTTADSTGLLPTPIVGPIIKLADSRRPTFASFSQRPMPRSGKTFERPRIVVRTLMGTQSAEGAELDSRALELDSETVTKATQGGTLDLSMQDIDWTDPSALQLVVQDFVDTYTEWTEGLAVAFLQAQIAAGDTASTGSTLSPYDDTSVTTLVKSYVDGFVKVYGKAKRMPDTVWHSLDAAAALTSKVSTTETRTALSMIREALGELGIQARFLVAPGLAANTRVIGASSLVEAYEQQKGLLRAELPSALKVQLAYAGYTAFYGRHEGFVKLGDAVVDS